MKKPAIVELLCVRWNELETAHYAMEKPGEVWDSELAKYYNSEKDRIVIDLLERGWVDIGYVNPDESSVRQWEYDPERAFDALVRVEA